MTKQIKAHKNILELIGNTPLIELNKITAGFKGNFYAKVEAFNPGHSSKDRIALYIIEQAEKKGILKKYKIPLVIQHTQGIPENMQNHPRYENELLDIYDFFEKKIKFLRSIGIKHSKIIIDPGIGFGKNLKHNMNLIRDISIFHTLGFPILVGVSKKRFIKEIAGINDTENRTGGTVASSLYLASQGVQILRIHDVKELMQSIKVFKNIIQN